MKKCFFVLILLLSPVVCSADYYWTNNFGTGDHDFTRGSNWLDTTDDVNWTTEDVFQVDFGGSVDYAAIGINEANAIGKNLFIGKLGSADGEVRVIGGDSSLGGNLLIGGEGPADTTAYGKLIISNGAISFSGYVTAGNRGTGDIEISGGTLTANRCNIGAYADSSGSLVMTGGVFSMPSYLRCGNYGTGTIDISGGSVTADSIAIGFGATADGSFSLSGSGTVEVTQYLTVGTFGTGSLDVSGGTIYADRSTIAQEVNSVGAVTLTGGELNLENQLELGRDGTATLTINGDAVKLRCDRIYGNTLSTIECVLNGSAGIGSGIEVCGGDANLSGLVDVDFSGSAVGGDYIVMTALDGTIIDSGAVGILTPESISAGWTSSIINAGAGEALVVSYPSGGSDVSWTNGGADQLWSTAGNWSSTLGVNDRAIIDLSGSSGAILNSSETVNSVVVGNTSSGSLNVATGASGQFVNMTIADSNTSTGSVAISDGTIDVASSVLAGVDGDASLSMTGGSLSAGSLLAAVNSGSSADIDISGSSVLYVEGALGLGAGGSLTISGSQTDVSLGSLSAAQCSQIVFGFDGALGVGGGIDVAGEVVLGGTIDIEDAGGGFVDGTYTVITASDITDNTAGQLIPSPLASYAIIRIGDVEELQITITTPTTCQEMIDAGLQLAGDVNGDCRVNMADFADLAIQWLQCNDPTLQGCDWTLGL